jgi:hypothetical protein
MRRVIPYILVSLLILAACEGQGEKKTESTAAFIGGSQALALQFTQLRPEVFDGGEDPFDVIVRLENKGEWDVVRDKAKVRLNGVNPSEFGKVPEDFAQSPPEDLLKVSRDSRSPPIDVEFRGLNYQARITGAALPPFPLVATACYGYGTRAVSRLCVRRDILKPTDGICTVEETKSVENSGSPVHIENFREQARARDRVAFVFDVKHVGSGAPYELNSQCAARQMASKVWVKVDSRIPGLSCSFSTGSGTEGQITLVDGVKTVSCSQPIATPGDYEQPISIELQYDYEDTVTTELVVKHAGE